MTPELTALLGERDPPPSWPCSAGTGCSKAFVGSLPAPVNDSPQR